jgi:hypothetical protein
MCDALLAMLSRQRFTVSSSSSPRSFRTVSASRRITVTGDSSSCANAWSSSLGGSARPDGALGSCSPDGAARPADSPRPTDSPQDGAEDRHQPVDVGLLQIGVGAGLQDLGGHPLRREDGQHDDPALGGATPDGRDGLQPVHLGMARSRMTTSGWCRADSRIDSTPSEASATTSKRPSLWRVLRMRSRMSSVSSPTRTRIGVCSRRLG